MPAHTRIRGRYGNSEVEPSPDIACTFSCHSNSLSRRLYLNRWEWRVLRARCRGWQPALLVSRSELRLRFLLTRPPLQRSIQGSRTRRISERQRGLLSVHPPALQQRGPRTKESPARFPRPQRRSCARSSPALVRQQDSKLWANRE